MLKIRRIEGIEIKLPNWKICAVVIGAILCYINKDYITIIEYFTK
jgi:hypothetical protein